MSIDINLIGVKTKVCNFNTYKNINNIMDGTNNFNN